MPGFMYIHMYIIRFYWEKRKFQLEFLNYDISNLCVESNYLEVDICFGMNT